MFCGKGIIGGCRGVKRSGNEVTGGETQTRASDRASDYRASDPQPLSTGFSRTLGSPRSLKVSTTKIYSPAMQSLMLSRASSLMARSSIGRRGLASTLLARNKPTEHWTLSQLKTEAKNRGMPRCVQQSEIMH